MLRGSALKLLFYEAQRAGIILGQAVRPGIGIQRIYPLSQLPF